MLVKRRLAIIAAGIGIAALATMGWLSWDRNQVIYQGKSLKAWALQLRAPDPAAREQAADALRMMGVKAVPGLIRLVNTKNTGSRKLVWSLATRLPRKPRAWFFREFPWPDPNEACVDGARGLGIIGPEAQSAVPALARALRSPAGGVSLEAAAALGHIGKASVPALISALHDDDPQVRHAAVFALGEIGPEAGAAVSVLIPLLNTTNAALRSSAAYSLLRIGLPELPALVDLARHGVDGAREAAAQVLLQYQASFRQAMPALAKLAADESPAVRQQALAMLGAIREADAMAVYLATRALKDPIEPVRLEAIAALGKLSAQTQVAAQPLIDCLHDESSAVREAAAAALGRMGAPASQAIPSLAALVEDRDPSVRAAANEALRMLRPAATATPVDVRK